MIISFSPGNEKFRVRLKFNKFPGGLFEFACCHTNLAQISPPTRQFLENQASVLIKLVLNIHRANNKGRGSPTPGAANTAEVPELLGVIKDHQRIFKALTYPVPCSLQAYSKGKKVPETQCQELKWRTTFPMGWEHQFHLKDKIIRKDSWGSNLS